MYRSRLDKLRAHVGEDPAALDGVAVVQFFTGLREHSLSASTIHQAYRTLKTFTRWLLATGVLRCNPLAGLSIKMPSKAGYAGLALPPAYLHADPAAAAVRHGGLHFIRRFPSAGLPR